MAPTTNLIKNQLSSAHSHNNCDIVYKYFFWGVILMASFIGVENEKCPDIKCHFYFPHSPTYRTNLHNSFILIAKIVEGAVREWLLANWFAFCYNVDMQFPFAA